jgi:hypothetical protein
MERAKNNDQHYRQKDRYKETDHDFVEQRPDYDDDR